MSTIHGHFRFHKPAPHDLGSARCRIPRDFMKRNGIATGQWIKFEDNDRILYACVWPIDIAEDDIIEVDDFVTKPKVSPNGEHPSYDGRSCSICPMPRFPQVAKELTVTIELHHPSDSYTSNREWREFSEFGFIWRNASQEMKIETIKGRLAGLLLIDGCTIQDERQCLKIKIQSTTPSNVEVLITPATQIKLSATEEEDALFDDSEISSITDAFFSLSLKEQPSHQPIAGLEKAYEALYEVISYPLLYPDLFRKMGVECPKGVLLYGPPGVGKTYLVCAVAEACEAQLITLHGSDVHGQYVGESEERLRETFAEANHITIADPNKAVIVFIDELDTLAPHRTQAKSHESRMVAQLLTLMDGMESRGRTIVIGATNRPNAVDPALRRPGRLDREIAVDIPNEKARFDILKSITSTMPIDSSVVLEALASVTKGYVGADLASLCREAAMNAMNRHTVHGSEKQIKMTDFKSAISRVAPSISRGLQVDVERTTWDDIGGLEEVKKKLQQSVTWPINYRNAYERLGLKPPRGILLYGPPGCSKTSLVKVIATISGASFISINGAHLYSPYVGDSEKIISSTFQRARSASPSIVFFDEIDAIVGKRSFDGSHRRDSVQERILSMLLNEMDGIEGASGVLVMGATNRPDMIDAALLRPGRFDRLIFVPPPDLAARRQILRIHTLDMPLSNDVVLDELAEKTEFYSGADLKNLCREAAMIALRETISVQNIEMRHFSEAMKNVQPSLTPEALKQYEGIG
ncbi:5530_t:CDS:10 [Paraglomus brasilianum]|uniref:5530_t:CDS:1 n=1 Tax=Paraglomus brasilianum TaxID=144538 RepID=A0A9N9A9L5_9GLOM|nr:5530_t:CDS:10 [Paraglomus brasilianum]